MPRGTRVAGANVVDGNCERSIFIRESALKPGHGGANGVRERHTVDGLLHGRGRDGDEAPPLVFLHARQSFLGKEDGAHQKQLNRIAPIFRLCVHEQFRRRTAGVGNTNVNSSEALLDGRNIMRYGSGIRNVDGSMKDFPARGILNVRGDQLSWHGLPVTLVPRSTFALKPARVTGQGGADARFAFLRSSKLLCIGMPHNLGVTIFGEGFVTEASANSMMILIAGPYRSGTNDDPALIRKNVEEMESYALSIFRAGHIPILGEWLALPLVALAGSRQIGDEAFDEIFHPIAVRLLGKCDGVLRVGGPSIGADEMVRVGRRLGLNIYSGLKEIPQTN